jgi:hypothetical protein
VVSSGICVAPALAFVPVLGTLGFTAQGVAAGKLCLGIQFRRARLANIMLHEERHSIADLEKVQPLLLPRQALAMLLAVLPLLWLSLPPLVVLVLP